MQLRVNSDYYLFCLNIRLKNISSFTKHTKKINLVKGSIEAGMKKFATIRRTFNIFCQSNFHTWKENLIFHNTVFKLIQRECLNLFIFNWKGHETEGK